jgi:hypothetical protein
MFNLQVKLNFRPSRDAVLSSPVPAIYEKKHLFNQTWSTVVFSPRFIVNHSILQKPLWKKRDKHVRISPDKKKTFVVQVYDSFSQTIPVYP